MFRFLSLLGDKVRRRQEEFHREKRRRLARGDVRWAWSWEDIEKAFNAAAELYRRGELDYDDAMALIDTNEQFVLTNHLMYEMRGLEGDVRKRVRRIAEHARMKVEEVRKHKSHRRHKRRRR